MLELVLRLGISLAVVLGLFWLVARTGARRLGGTRGLMRVHGRQSLSRTASVAVVEVGSRVLVVGVSDGGVRLLTELDPEELAVEDPAPALVAPGTGPTARLASLVASRLTARRAETTVRGSALPAGPDGALTAVPDGPLGAVPGDDAPPVAVHAGALSGSLLAPETWRQAWAAATSRSGTPIADAVTASLGDPDARSRPGDRVHG